MLKKVVFISTILMIGSINFNIAYKKYRSIVGKNENIDKVNSLLYVKETVTIIPAKGILNKVEYPNMAATIFIISNK